MTYQLMQSDLEFVAFLDWAERNAARIERRETKPKTHAERVMVRYARQHTPQEDSTGCRCNHNKETTA